MTQESKSRGLLTSPMIYSLREYLDRNTGRGEEKGITHLQGKCVACSPTPHILPPLWRGHRAGPHGLGSLHSCEEGAHHPSQPGPWGSCYEHTQELTHSGNFHLQQHQVSWENTSSSRRIQVPHPSFSLLSSHPSHPPYHSMIKKKKQPTKKKTAFGILLQQSCRC